VVEKDAGGVFHLDELFHDDVAKEKPSKIGGL